MHKLPRLLSAANATLDGLAALAAEHGSLGSGSELWRRFSRRSTSEDFREREHKLEPQEDFEEPEDGGVLTIQSSAVYLSRLLVDKKVRGRRHATKLCLNRALP